MLGAAVHAAFKSGGHTALGLAHSRPSAELRQLDLLDAPATEALFAEFKPDCTYFALRALCGVATRVMIWNC